jgi:MazG family protein
VETSQPVNPPPSFSAVLDLIAALRAENGCPWDRKQTPRSSSVYLIEEAYELVDAILCDDDAAIREELGDVLFQVLFLLSLYQQAGRMTVSEVLAQNLKKMIRRHPHVFGAEKMDTAGEVKQRWKEIKRQEKGRSNAPASLLDSVPAGMPGLMRAFRISERAAGAGFEWDHLGEVIEQVESEWAEFKAELHLNQPGAPVDKGKAAMEFGDVLFSMINVARVAGLHPETALSTSTQKFIDRFRKMEDMAAEKNTRLEDLPREEMEDLWRTVKKEK